MGILDGMNDKQYEAATCTEGPELIIAGAGSGKTRVLTHRIAYLIEHKDVNPYNIMAITFTNKAAGEMRERIDKIVSFGSESIWVMTFHSTCVRILRRYIDHIGYDNNFTIYDTDDCKSVMKGVFKKLQIDTKQLKEATVLREIGRAKDELLGPKEYEAQNAADFGKKKFIDCYNEYQEQLRKNNALDFDDLIRLTVYLFKACPEILDAYQERFKYIMVDEYQDTNTAQFEFVRLLADKYRNLCVVGDDDQSIYKFRGANIMNILNFEKVYEEAKVVKLEQNYRSTQTILNAANAVIANNKGRKSKALWTDREDDEPIYFKTYENAKEEAQEVVSEIASYRRKGKYGYGDCAILYRTNAQSREFEEYLVKENIPYQLVGGINFYARKEIKDLLAYLKTIDNAQDDLQVRRIINVPKRGIGATSIQKVADFADARNVSFFEACTRADEIPGLNKGAEKIRNFSLMIRGYRTRLSEGFSIMKTMEAILEDTAYMETIKLEDEETAQERTENINEFLTKIKAYEEEHEGCTLSEFLEEIALVSDLDNVEDNVQRVLMMTIHSAKGLEFPVVYLSGMEDGIFPSYMTINNGLDEDIEEERRLAYVAMTRAKDRLSISHARARMIRGETQYNPLSRFVKEIPKEYLKGELPRQKVYHDEMYSDVSSARNFFKESPYGGGGDGFIPVKKSFVGMKSNATGFLGGSGAGKSSDTRKSLSNNVSPVVLTKGSDIKTGDLEYTVGDRVSHVKFGEGQVLDIVKGARDYQVTVSFDKVGQKVMYASFAKLKKI